MKAKEIENPILSIRGLKKQFGEGCSYCLENKNLEKNYCPSCGTIYACRNINFDLYKGEVLGIVGESGSGKSTMMQCLYFDKEPSVGEFYTSYYGEGKINLFDESSQRKNYIRNNILGKVYQNPILGLKMNFSSISNIAENLIKSGEKNVGIMKERSENLLNEVNIPLFRINEAPKNFSGGMQQRVQIAKALSTNPPILLLDEVTTGLDLSVQANVLDLIKKLQRELSISMIVVSHDLSVIRMLADRTLVMLDGAIIESGLTDQILEDPQTPYSQQLVYSLL